MTQEAAFEPGVTPTSTEPMLRTTLGTPQQETVTPRTWTRPILGAGAGLGIGVASAGGWLYWRRRQQQRHRPGWRARRSAAAFLTDLGQGKPAPLTTSVASGVILLAALARARRRPGGDNRQPEAGRNEATGARAARVDGRVQADGAARVSRVPVAVLLPLLAISAVVVWFRARGSDRPRYIGTPGVESALGRDLTQTGELPPEMGFEQPYQ